MPVLGVPGLTDGCGGGGGGGGFVDVVVDVAPPTTASISSSLMQAIPKSKVIFFSSNETGLRLDLQNFNIEIQMDEKMVSSATMRKSRMAALFHVIASICFQE